LEKWEQFEVEVANALEKVGWRCIRSCYITNEGITSQIDIIAVSGYGVLAVECKSYKLDRLTKSRYGNELIGYRNETAIFRGSVLSQANNHATQVYLSGVTHIEEKLKRRRFAHVHSIVVFEEIRKKIGIRDDIKNILDIKRLTSNDIWEIVPRLKVYSEDEIALIVKHFNQYSDTSEERAKRHGEYLKKAKKTNTGMWDEERKI